MRSCDKDVSVDVNEYEFLLSEYVKLQYRYGVLLGMVESLTDRDSPTESVSDVDYYMNYKMDK
jgi:hypothetical protein